MSVINYLKEDGMFYLHPEILGGRYRFRDYWELIRAGYDGMDNNKILEGII